MQIIHKIDSFLYDIFPNAILGDEVSLINEVIQFYTFGIYKPEVRIVDGWLTVSINTVSIKDQEARYRDVIRLCEKGNFKEAKPKIISLISENPTVSEYHRILGQILSDEGNQEEAVNSLIDALRWDAKNSYALLMMGNIFAKFYDDINTAMKYYDQALIVNPDDNITLNNIGGNLLQQGKIENAKKYFDKALEINGDYPNTHYALGIIADLENDLHSAFYSFIQAVKKSKVKDGLYKVAVNQALTVANKIVSQESRNKHIDDFKTELEGLSLCEVKIKEDDSIPTAAKLEVAENYHRNYHLIKFKRSSSAIDHLVMHELVHLQFITEARNVSSNLLYTVSNSNKEIFNRDLSSYFKNLLKAGYSQSVINNFSESLFDGINRQIFNAPIDLFIEEQLYNEYPELRAVQFLSIGMLLKEAIQGFVSKKAVDLMPKPVLSVSKIYNLVAAIQYKDLFGLDYTSDFLPTPSELSKANELYEEFLEYKEDKEAGEEYELLLNWARDLKVDNYFTLVSDSNNMDGNNIDEMLSNIEADPFEAQNNNPLKEIAMADFQAAHAGKDVNMAVVMFMVDAIKYFKGLNSQDIKGIAFEIAMLGTQGFSPEKKGYRVNLIPGKEFSGYHILAYYYVSWAIAIPEMLPSLKLPFDKEYDLAKTFGI